MKIIYDSRQDRFKTPFGAAKTGTDILLSVEVTDCLVKKAYIELRKEGTDRYRRFRLSNDPRKPDLYTVKLNAPRESCLIWYRFRIEAELDDGIHTVYYCNNADRLGGEGQAIDLTGDDTLTEGMIADISSEGRLAPYQITVYQEVPVPEWYKQGIVYQIFPDRFARDSEWEERCSQAIQFVNDRRDDTKRMIEEDWSKPAYYERDDMGKVTGWPIYGGSLKGIESKLAYLKSLGVSVIYLNPVFEATSNHRYDTGNYLKIDPALGTEDDFVHLAEEAERKGIRLILDGVFSHTGADSLYFDRYGNYGGNKKGAWQGEDSPYRSWYKFDENERIGYKSWWGVEDLPEVDENNSDYRRFILGENGVAAYWLNRGASGWRLDVADELPDSFIKAMRARVKSVDPDDLLIGEVWEDASNKVSYGERREYFAGDELDGTMNYPIRTILLDYINYTIDAGKAEEHFMSLAENYPRENFYGALNLIGSHDRERILTMMAEAQDRPSAVSKVKILSTLQYALPGVPCVYYGDEAGCIGGADPENRGCFPWGHEDQSLEYHYRMLGLIYNEHTALKDGSFEMLPEVYDISDDVLAFVRGNEEERILVLANRSYGPVDVNLMAENQDEQTEQTDQDGQTEQTEQTDQTESCLKCGYALDLLSSTELKLESDGSFGKVHMEPLSVRLICLLDEAPEKQDIGHKAGVICHVGSLGEQPLGKKAESFIDYISKAGFGVWQVLPVNPKGLGDSPYVSNAAFAGEPDFIDRSMTLKEAADVMGYDEFLSKNDRWLSEYTAYTIIKEMMGGLPWYEWPDEYKLADPDDIMKELIRVRPKRIRELEKEQYFFAVEWQRMREYAHSKGVQIMGDIPIYVGLDSADVWANREVFQLDENGRLKAHAGVPPDYFSEDGQDWGNPLYDWDALKKSGYDWWLRRLRQCAERFDILRLDHFRSLSAYYSIPEGHKPKDGSWQQGPGPAFTKAISEMLRNESIDMKLVAEDLGALDDEVLNLIKLSGFSGMNVWQFSADEMMAMPEETAASRLFYVGTHDNNTLVGFLHEKEESEQTSEEQDLGDAASEDVSEDVADAVPKNSTEAEVKGIIEKVYESPAALAVMQLQDVFLLGEEARMNVPGKPEGNWKWKIPGDSIEDAFPDADMRAEWLRDLAARTGRV